MKTPGHVYKLPNPIFYKELSFCFRKIYTPYNETTIEGEIMIIGIAISIAIVVAATAASYKAMDWATKN